MNHSIKPNHKPGANIPAVRRDAADGFRCKGSGFGRPVRRRGGRSRWRFRGRSGVRLGAVIVEMAVCLPLMLLVVFGCLDISRAIFRAQTLTSAAHEGALVGLRPNATLEEVGNRVSTVLRARGVDQFVVNIETFGTQFESLEAGQPFRIELRSTVNSDYITARTISASVTGLRP